MNVDNISVSLEKKKLEDKGDNIVLKFSDGVIPMGGVIKIFKGTKVIERIKLGSKKTTGDLYHSSSIVWDYPYNLIALENYEIFKHLANHANVEIGDKTEEEWANELRSLWNISVNGRLYRLDKDEYISTDESHNYHTTTPEYTPGEDESGTGNIILSPLGGIKRLTINSSKLRDRQNYTIKLNNARFLSATGNSNDYLKFKNLLGFKVDKRESIREDIERDRARGEDSNSFYAGEISVKRSQSISMSKGGKFRIKEMNGGNFAIAKNRKELKKLSRSNVDVVYEQTTGKLYLNDNLKEKGWAKKGKRSLLAKFKGKPDLSNSNFDGLIDYSKDYDKSGAKYSDSKSFLNAYRDTPRSKLLKLFERVEAYEKIYDAESGIERVYIHKTHNFHVSSTLGLEMNKNRSDQYDAFKRNLWPNGDFEILTQGEEKYFFF